MHSMMLSSDPSSEETSEEEKWPGHCILQRPEQPCPSRTFTIVAGIQAAFSALSQEAAAAERGSPTTTTTKRGLLSNTNSMTTGSDNLVQQDDEPLDERPTKIVASEQKGRKDNAKRRHARVFVQHSYHDHANDLPESEEDAMAERDKTNRPRWSGSVGTHTPFPMVLHDLLDNANARGYADVISWQPHGRAFMVHQPDVFVSEIMPRFFRQTRFSSFQRQVSLYGFLRLSRRGTDYSAYYHELFLRDKYFLARRIQRTRVKGYWVRQCASPETEPDFSSMPPVGGRGGGGRGEISFAAMRVENTRGLALPLASYQQAKCNMLTPVVNYYTQFADDSMEPRIFSSSALRLPPMPQLEIYRDLGGMWPNVATALSSVSSCKDGTTGTMVKNASMDDPVWDVGWAAEAGSLLAFLSDVDLESDDDSGDEDTGCSELTLAEIYAHTSSEICYARMSSSYHSMSDSNKKQRSSLNC
jgi:hypothetical protein